MECTKPSLAPLLIACGFSYSAGHLLYPLSTVILGKITCRAAAVNGKAEPHARVVFGVELQLEESDACHYKIGTARQEVSLHMVLLLADEAACRVQLPGSG